MECVYTCNGLNYVSMDRNADTLVTQQTLTCGGSSGNDRWGEPDRCQGELALLNDNKGELPDQSLRSETLRVLGDYKHIL